MLNKILAQKIGPIPLPRCPNKTLIKIFAVSEIWLILEWNRPEDIIRKRWNTKI
jgi:hypothetical protein